MVIKPTASGGGPGKVLPIRGENTQKIRSTKFEIRNSPEAGKNPKSEFPMFKNRDVQKIACCVDFSDNAEAAFRTAMEMAKKLKGGD